MRSVKFPTDRHVAESSVSTQAAVLSFGLAAPLLTYVIAVSDLSQPFKVTALVTLSVLYVAICTWSVLRMRAVASASDTAFEVDEPGEGLDFERKLLAFDDAREFFGTSLKPADMFRLVANRINEIVPVASSVLLTKNSETGSLSCVHASGANASRIDGSEINGDESLAGLAFLSAEIESSAEMENEKRVFPDGAMTGLASSAALPLLHDGDAFAVLQLFFAGSDAVTSDVLVKLQAVSERVSPLFLGSMAFERSLSNALTDHLTKLPNERAFHMVLENQLAECARFRDDRPLTVLAVDIKNFEEMNREYGHATGDRALSFVADKISSQLRKMDFLARSMNDEFLIVLPKATERTAIEITGRIQACLASSPMSVSDEESVKLWLNYGWATFWKDGETAPELLQGAFLRKQQAKTEDSGNVVLFPKDYVN